MKASSKWVFPDITLPSTAIFIPGLHTKISSFFIWSIVTFVSLSSVFKRAFSGVIVTNSCNASFVLFLLFWSTYFPIFIKNITIQTDS